MARGTQRRLHGESAFERTRQSSKSPAMSSGSFGAASSGWCLRERSGTSSEAKRVVAIEPLWIDLFDGVQDEPGEVVVG